MPAKEILRAIRDAIRAGWNEPPGRTGGRAHIYKKLFCPGGRGCCPPLFINGTPDVAEHEAAKIYKAVAGCPASK
ncbi:hypothetical protein [Microbispora bryophytorum]|uniref:hypothetical protein n=1 Tax=Microbispora bryophytorum TaxID=1460882 RepID=UPI0037143365